LRQNNGILRQGRDNDQIEIILPAFFVLSVFFPEICVEMSFFLLHPMEKTQTGSFIDQGYRHKGGCDFNDFAGG
jgi:hypothetical protein